VIYRYISYISVVADNLGRLMPHRSVKTSQVKENSNFLECFLKIIFITLLMYFPRNITGLFALVLHSYNKSTFSLTF
jgi:hypothetical protein